MKSSQSVFTFLDTPVGQLWATASPHIEIGVANRRIRQLVAEMAGRRRVLADPRCGTKAARHEGVTLAETDDELARVASLKATARNLVGPLYDQKGPPDPQAEMTIWTDGSWRDRDQIGSWACYSDTESWACGTVMSGGSFGAELQAVLEAAATAVQLQRRTVIVTDCESIPLLLAGGAEPRRAIHRDRWNELLRYVSGGLVTVSWTRGHTNSVGNQRADQLARMWLRSEGSAAEHLVGHWRGVDQRCERLLSDFGRQ